MFRGSLRKTGVCSNETGKCVITLSEEMAPEKHIRLNIDLHNCGVKMEKDPIYRVIPNVVPLSEDEDPQLHPATNKKGAVFGKRHGQVFMMACISFIYSICEHSMSVSLVAMTDPTASINKNIPTYNWTNKNSIISAYMWGTTIPQLVGGWLVNTYGPKWFIVGSMVISSCVGLIIPVSASVFGEMGVLVCRTIQGLCLSILPSGSYALLAKWIPICERSSMSTVMLTGQLAGGMFSLFSSGYIAASWYGWPMTFYCYNSFGLLWILLFMIFVKNCPRDHPAISQEELLFIENGGGPAPKRIGTPWKQILTSPCLWAIILAQITYMWVSNAFIAILPVYMKSVLRANIESNAVISAALLLAKWILSIFFGFLGDYVISRKILNVGTTRKIMHAISSLVPCINLFLLGCLKLSDWSGCVALLITSVGFTSASISGHLVNFLDIAPNHGGTLFGLSSQIAMAIASAAPLVLNSFVSDEVDLEQWKYFFYLTSAMLAVSTVIFSIFASGETQSWNEEIRKDDDSHFPQATKLTKGLLFPRERRNSYL